MDLLDHWLFLTGPDPGARVGELVEHLRGVAALRPSERWPFLGPASSWVSHPDPRVRGAALATLADMTGSPAWRILCDGLDDGDPEVRRIAVGALRQSVDSDPPRWVLALYHSRADVRALAVQEAPRRLPSFSWMRLLGDPHTRAAVYARLERDGLPHTALRVLLDHLDAGHLDDAWLLDRLAALPWEREVHRILRVFSSTERDLAPRQAHHLTLVSHARAQSRLADRLDGLIELLCRGQAAGHPGPAVVFERLLGRARRDGLRAEDEERLGVAILVARLAHERPVPPAALALAALVQPTVLAVADLPVPERRAAARELVGVRRERDAAVAVGQLEPAQLFLEAGEPDVRVGAALVALAGPEALPVLAGTVHPHALVDALVADPEAGAWMIGPITRPATARTTRSRLMTEALRRHGAAAAPLLAAMAVVCPSDWPVLPARVDPEVEVAFLAALDEAARTRALREKLVLRIAEGLVGASSPRALVARVLHRPVLDGPVSREVLARAFRELRPRAVKGLAWAAIRQLIALDRAEPVLPYAVQQNVALALLDHADPEIAEWAREAMPAGAPPSPPPVTRRRSLRFREARRIRTCTDAELAAAVAPGLAGPTSGLVDALAARSGPAPQVPEVCAALLVGDDPLEDVAVQLVRFGQEHPGTLNQVDRILVRDWAGRDDMGPGGAAWLHRWDKPLSAFLRWMTPTAEGLRRVLGSALLLPSPCLRGALWRAVRRQLGIWRWREVEQVQQVADDAVIDLVVQVLGGRRPEGAGTGSWPLDQEDREELQVVAAEILRRLHGASVPLERVRARVQAVFGDLPHDARRLLSTWLDTRAGAPTSPRRAPPPSPAGELTLEAARTPADLATLLHHPTEAVAAEAALRLVEVGEPAVSLILEALLVDHAPHRGVLSQTISLWPAGPSLVAALAESRAASRSPEVRFHLGLGLLEYGEDVADELLEIARLPSEEVWLRVGELDRLLSSSLDRCALACALVHARGFTALSWASAFLVGGGCDDARARPALRVLLLRGDASPDLRLRAALWLRERGEILGEPLILADRMRRAKGGRDRDTAVDWASWLPADSVVRAARSAVLAGGHHVPGRVFAEGLGRPLVDPAAVEPAALVLLTEAEQRDVQEAALALLRNQALRSRAARRLAEVFLWGRDQARKLLGRRYRIRMIGGEALGWTRLDQRVVHVNPLPLLRGERGGAAILRGLVIHELGHHVYNADADGLRVAEQASRIGLARLHNLVCDEHLERNLRSHDADYGDDLKQLAAWAFLHANRSLDAVQLLTMLGLGAAAVLVPVQLAPARPRGQVVVGLGHLFKALEASGSSFARFVRALRMGLGNRSGDPLVAKALALFGKDFRRLDNDGLYRVTLALRDLFGDEASLLDLLGLHATADADATSGDQLVEGRGVSDVEVEREVDRLDRERNRTPMPVDLPGGGEVQLNTGPAVDFDDIDRLETLVHDPEEHALLAAEVARPARHLRQVLTTLGLRYRVIRGRSRGVRVDRTRLQAAVIRGDPRILVARERVHAADLFLGAVVDCSGSMQGDRIERARRYATLLAEAAWGLDGVDVRLFGFTDQVIFDAGSDERCAAHALEASGGNNDAAGLWHTAQHALRSRRQARLLVMISDGLPTECTTTSLRTLVHRLQRRHGIACAQIAVAPIHEHCFDTYIEVVTDDMDESVRRFGQIIGRLVATTLRG